MTEKMSPAPMVAVAGPAPMPLGRLRHIRGDAPHWLLWLCAGVALLLSWSIIRDRLGLGVTVGGLALLGVTMWRTERTLPMQRGALALLSAALWTVPAWRDAGWVVFLAILAAMFTTWFTVAMSTQLSGLLPLLVTPMTEIPAGAVWAAKSTRRVNQDLAVRVIQTAMLSIGLAILFGGLFAAADPAFAGVMNWLFSGLSVPLVTARLVVTGLFLAVILGLVHWAGSKPTVDGWPWQPTRVGRLDWLAPLIVVNAVFVLFIVLQARTLFGGDDYVMDTAGLTYAEYARSGFWLLSIITVLSLAVIAAGARWAPRSTRGDRWVLRVVLGGLSLMSLVVVVSALARMDLYSQVYGLTRLRVWVFAVEVWIGVLFCLVLFCGIRLRAAWLARAAVGTGAAVIVALAAINPEALIAQQNLERYDATGDIDLTYLGGLSPDALAVVDDRLDGEKRDCVVSRMLGDLDGGDDLLSWNLSRAVAAERYSDTSSLSCRAWH